VSLKATYLNYCSCCGNRIVTTAGCLRCASYTLCGTCHTKVACGCGRKIENHVCPNLVTEQTMTTLVELYAGTAALTLHLFGLKPPVSRIGSKQGYAAAIAEELGLWTFHADAIAQELELWAFYAEFDQHAVLTPPFDKVLLVDTDPWICATLRALCIGYGPAVAACLEAYLPTKAEWKRERALLQLAPSGHSVSDAARWLFVTAASRGGVGGFKGGHIRRPSVKGWIPSLPSLCERLQAFDKPLPVEVRGCRAEDVSPFGDSVVYMDPPYYGRTGYPSWGPRVGSFEINKVLRAWLRVGATVAISGPDKYRVVPTERKLTYALRKVKLTHRRKGQTRRSLTRSNEEWLHIFKAK
jgi:hypothetical protein